MTPRLAASPRERGFALLLAVLLLFAGATTWYLASLSPQRARLALDERTARTLSIAREALIARAVNDSNRPGSLPCPDTNDDGNAEALVGNECPAYLGRFPYKTLQTGELQDAQGEHLWYALAREARDYGVVNSSMTPTLALDTHAQLMAVLIAPGIPLNGQNRPSNAAADYLDGPNAMSTTSFVSILPNTPFNDRLLAVTPNDIFPAVHRRVLALLRGPDDQTPSPPNTGLRRFYADQAVGSKRFPLADTNTPLPYDQHEDAGATSGRIPALDFYLDPTDRAWLNANGWLPLVSYTVPNAVNPNSALLGLGSLNITVLPCTSAPCP